MPVCLLSKPTLTKLMHAMEKIEAHLNPVTKIVSCSDNFCKSSFQKPFHKQWSSEADISGAGGHDHYTDCYFREPRLFPLALQERCSLSNPSVCIYIGI